MNGAAPTSAGASNPDVCVPRLHIVLYQPEIPQNTGNAGRTCLAVGAKLWMVRPLGFQLNEKKLRRAGMDYWIDLDWEVVDSWEILVDRLPARKWCFSKFAERSYTTATFAPGDALVFGSETSGLPGSIRDACPEQALRIPMEPPARSLNLATSVAIAGYEAIRQWNT